MTERFRAPERAASYLCTGLIHDFPDSEAEIIFLSSAKSRRVQCEVKKIGHVLEDFCKDFPKCSVDYFPQNVYGVVAEIRCHGDRQHERKKTHGLKEDRRHRDQPVVIVMLNDSNGKFTETA